MKACNNKSSRLMRKKIQNTLVFLISDLSRVGKWFGWCDALTHIFISVSVFVKVGESNIECFSIQPQPSQNEPAAGSTSRPPLGI